MPDTPPPQSVVVPPETTGGSAVVDFDVHGVVALRTIGAGAGDLRAVRAQLGPSTDALGREPDITIRYVDRLPLSTQLRYLGAHDMAFTDDAFLVLRGRHKKSIRALLPLGAVGGTCEILCEHGVGRVPLLIAVLNLTVLARGGVALHASAFELEGAGVVTTGWSKGGKTEAMLAFVSHGARYVGDEWVWIHPTLGVCGLPEPVRVWDWHLDQLPAIRRRTPFRDRARLKALGATSRVDLGALPGGSRVSDLVSRHRGVDLAVERLGDEPVVPSRPTTLDRLFLMTSTQALPTVATPVDPIEVADRMSASLTYERLPLAAAYHAFRYAFPDVTNPHLEGASELERERLRVAFTGVTAFSIEHPYPVSLARLREVMSPCIGRAR